MTTFIESLHQVIDLSQQLIDEINAELPPTENNNEQDNNILRQAKLAELASKRERLIKSVFNEKQTKHYASNAELINEIGKLDNVLIDAAQKQKLSAKSELLIFKKNQKANKTYNTF